MDPIKIGNLIKEIRKNNNLTQKDLADKYGVTYQAVSKWESGSNLPDIAILKQISDDYNIDINDFLNGDNKTKKKTKNKLVYILFIIIFILIIALIVLAVTHYRAHMNEGYSFKTLSTTCDNFKITGSLVYDSSKSSISIGRINYCGGDDNNKYSSITCNLYEGEEIIYTCDKKENVKLEDYLDELSIKVDDYYQKCSLYKEEDILTLKITATKNNIDTVYNIPLHIDDNC